jgi:hypothetical protein
VETFAETTMETTTVVVVVGATPTVETIMAMVAVGATPSVETTVARGAPPVGATTTVETTVAMAAVAASSVAALLPLQFQGDITEFVDYFCGALEPHEKNVVGGGLLGAVFPRFS